MREAFGLVLALISATALAAPVPSHLMAKPEVQLRYNPASHPLGNSFEVSIRNVGGADLQVWTDRLHGVATFVDAEIRNEKDERISRLYRWSSPANLGAVVRLAETIPKGKTCVSTYTAFQSVDDARLVPGKYKVRVRFSYLDHDAASDWVSVEVTPLHIRTKHLGLGP